MDNRRPYQISGFSFPNKLLLFIGIAYWCVNCSVYAHSFYLFTCSLQWRAMTVYAREAQCHGTQWPTWKWQNTFESHPSNRPSECDQNLFQVMFSVFLRPTEAMCLSEAHRGPINFPQSLNHLPEVTGDVSLSCLVAFLVVSENPPGCV